MIVFLGGSASIRELPVAVCDYLTAVTAEHEELSDLYCEFVIGDCHGGDFLLQKALSSIEQRGKRRLGVTVHHMGRMCRNNEGYWRCCQSFSDLQGREYYSVKDKVMSEKCDRGFMIWDGVSAGTLDNIQRLVELGKPVVVYLMALASFYTIESPRDLYAFMNYVKNPRWEKSQ